MNKNMAKGHERKESKGKKRQERKKGC